MKIRPVRWLGTDDQVQRMTVGSVSSIGSGGVWQAR